MIQDMTKQNIWRTCLWGLSLCASLVLSSCLGEHPKDQIAESEIYKTTTDIYTNAVASLYNYIGGSEESEGLQGTCRGIYDYNTLTTDEAIIPIRGGDWYDGGLWNAMYQHKWTATDEPLYDTWKYLYKVIMLTNKSLDVIEDHSNLFISEGQKLGYEAEVRAIRAMFYYYTMDMYGRIPLVLSAHEGQEGNVAVTQSLRSDVFRFVFKELQEALPYLPTGRSNQEGAAYGRVTQAVASFLLAKLALNAEIYTYDNWVQGYQNRPDGKQIMFVVDGKTMNAWQTCVYYCNKVQSAGYVLESRYLDNFAAHNEKSNENIFTIPMDQDIYSAQYHYQFRSYHYAHGAALGWGTENGTCATISTMKANHYGEPDEDTRCYYNFVAGIVTVGNLVVTLDNGKPLEYQPFEVKQNLTNSPYVKTAGARMAKYDVDRTSYMDGKLKSNDIVLFRYADVLLMRAEAKVRDGEDGSEDMNAVRSRVNMPARPATLDNILEERLLELVWEGWRRQDLIRFGKYTGAYDLREPLENESSGYTTVFPIPQRCIDLNNKLVQNFGY